MWAHGRQRESRDGARRSSAGACICRLQVAQSQQASRFFWSHGMHGVDTARVAQCQGECGLTKFRGGVAAAVVSSSTVSAAGDWVTSRDGR